MLVHLAYLLICCFIFFFFQVMTQLQYIEDSEPVVDGSRNHDVLCREQQKQTKGATKLSN